MKHDIPIELYDSQGRSAGALPVNATELAREAEALARSEDLAKRTALERVLRKHLQTARCEADAAELTGAVDALDAVRKGDGPSRIQINVRPSGRQGHARRAQGEGGRPGAPPGRAPAPSAQRPAGASFFELEREYPDEEARAWYGRLVGLDEHKQRLLTELEILLFPERLERWSVAHHETVLQACALYRNRVPLVLLHGDVGTGKTALAETVGDALARRVDGRVHLLKVNTQVRGTGLVGEMSDLIAQAFAQAVARAEAAPTEPVLLLIDEADALASSREGQQMHHEDKAGINTLLQRLDNLRLLRLPIAALFVTNRPEALDPAVRRRAALDLSFDRPNDDARAALFRTAVPELRLSREQLARLVRMTGTEREGGDGVPFTASDVTDRLLPTALRTAYVGERTLTVEDLLQAAAALTPSPRCGTR